MNDIFTSRKPKISSFATIQNGAGIPVLLQQSNLNCQGKPALNFDRYGFGLVCIPSRKQRPVKWVAVLLKSLEGKEAPYPVNPWPDEP